MSTVTRPELSKKSKYYISKERYYELLHFCRQYPEWKKELIRLGNGLRNSPLCAIEGCDYGDSYIEKLVLDREKWLSKIELVETVAKQADNDIWKYLIKAVTQKYSCEYLIQVEGMPCGRDMFYDRYRRFFWLLDQARR